MNACRGSGEGVARGGRGGGARWNTDFAMCSVCGRRIRLTQEGRLRVHVPVLAGADKRHRPRFDTSVCSDPAECEQVFHLQLAAGDTCECCGEDVGA